MTHHLDKWYETLDVGEGIWAIGEHGSNSMCLIYGEERYQGHQGEPSSSSSHHFRTRNARRVFMRLDWPAFSI